MWIWARAGAILAVAALTGCALPQPPQGKVPPVPQLGGLPVTRDQALALLDVIESVEPVAESECTRLAPQRPCDFTIVIDDRPGMPPNAFQTVDDRGRPILALTLALLGAVANEDEFAFVLSHEAAHHIAGHLDRQAQAATIGATVLGQIAGQLPGGSAQSVRAAEQLGAAIGARSYSQDFELEADALGAVIAARAGYDPRRGAQFFLRIPDPGNTFLGTHPPNAARMLVVERTLAGLGL